MSIEKLIRRKYRPTYSVTIREVRGERTQAEFARLCNVTQVTISRWESGSDEPTSSAYARLATLCGQPHRTYFWELSGFQDLLPQEPNMASQSLPATAVAISRRDEMRTGVRYVPLLRDGVATPQVLAQDDSLVSELLPFPQHWFLGASQLIAVKAKGESMSPLVPNGSIVVVDTSRQDPEALVGCIVAIREPNGITLKWLQRDGETYILVPEHASAEQPATVLRSEGDNSLVGSVVKWVGSPSHK